MKSAVRTLLLAGLVFALRAEPPVGRVRVYGRSEIASAVPEQQAFQRFVSAFRAEMGKRAGHAGESGWEFWIVLRGDPKQAARPHVLVVGRTGKLMVKVADIPSAELNVARDCARAADRSVDLMRSAAPRSTAAAAR